MLRSPMTPLVYRHSRLPSASSISRASNGSPPRPSGGGGQVERCRLSVRSRHHRRRVAGTGHGAAPGYRVVYGVKAGGADYLLAHGPFAGPLLFGRQQGDQVVQAGEDLVRFQVEAGERMYGGTQPAHGGGSMDAASHHVADDEGDPGPGQRNDVEPVAAQARGRAGRQVPQGHLDGRLVRNRPGQKAALQGERGLLLLGEAPGVVDGNGGARGEFLGEGEIVRLEGIGAERTPQGHRTQHQATRGKRYHDQRVDAQVRSVDPLVAFH